MTTVAEQHQAMVGHTLWTYEEITEVKASLFKTRPPHLQRPRQAANLNGGH